MIATPALILVASTVLAGAPAAPAPPAGAARPAAPQVDTALMSDLKREFLADRGKVRLLCVFAPTCSHCIEAAGEVQQALSQVSSPDLRAYIFWLPILQTDSEERAAAAAAQVTDPRAHHFWNPDKAVAAAAARAMGITNQLPEAWDVFLVFGPDVGWKGDDLPEPTAWLHRLSHEDRRWMTPDALRKVLRALLPDPPAAPARPDGHGGG